MSRCFVDTDPSGILTSDIDSVLVWHFAASKWPLVIRDPSVMACTSALKQLSDSSDLIIASSSAFASLCSSSERCNVGRNLFRRSIICACFFLCVTSCCRRKYERILHLNFSHSSVCTCGSSSAMRAYVFSRSPSICCLCSVLNIKCAFARHMRRYCRASGKALSSIVISIGKCDELMPIGNGPLPDLQFTFCIHTLPSMSWL